MPYLLESITPKPDRIKIDEDGDFEISYIDTDYQECSLYYTFEEIEEAYLLAKAKRDTGDPVKLIGGEEPDGSTIP